MGDFAINGVNLLNPSDPQARREAIKKSSVMIVWLSFEAHMEMNTNDHSSRALLIQKFPFEEFSEDDLDEIVLKSNHMSSCKTCCSHIIERRKLYLTKSRDISLTNCIQLRKLANQYDDDNWKSEIDNFIAKNFSEACKEPDSDVIKSLCTDDILGYVKTATRSCNKLEFAAIINWVRTDETRYSLFPELLIDEGQPGFFKTSLRSLCELENESILSSWTKYLLSSEQKPNWIVSEDNFGFVRYLTQQYDCVVTQKQLDRFVCENLSQLANKPDVGCLPVDAIKKYALDEAYYVDGATHGSIWILIKNWIKQQSHITKEELSKILSSVQIGKLSYEILREYSKHDIVRESSSCQANLIEVILANASAVKNSHVSLKKHVSNTEHKIEKMKVEVAKITERDASRDKVFTDLKNDVTSKLSKSGDSLKLCKDLEKHIIQLEHSTGTRLQHLEKRINDLEGVLLNYSKRQLQQAGGTASQSGDHQRKDRLELIEVRVRNLEAMLPEAVIEEKQE